jgi:uncharacterized protein YjbI with pentapeptide repeats
MDPAVESALISGGATIVSVLATAAVAIVGYRSSRSTNRATIDAAHADIRQTLAVTRDGQIADLYGRGVEQLGSANQDVRIGGIYALERVARESEPDHPQVMEVLTAFMRVHAFEREQHEHPTRSEVWREVRPDVQAAVTVVGRRNTTWDDRSIDLTGARLPFADLAEADFNQARLVDVNLQGANLKGAYLIGADFTGARLDDATLTDAHLFRAKWPVDAPVPEGWKLDTSSGRLERAGTDSGIAEAN